jgi:hypothetical protein
VLHKDGIAYGKVVCAGYGLREIRWFLVLVIRIVRVWYSSIGSSSYKCTYCPVGGSSCTYGYSSIGSSSYKCTYCPIGDSGGPSCTCGYNN